MVAIVAVAFFSVFYLVTGRERWDRLGAATAETGVVFGALMLITGIVWARPVWGVWWTGEAKLTTALILFFVYVAYLMFRAYFPPGTQRRRLAAVIALIGAIDAPIIYWAANLWAEAHPPLIVGPARDPDSALSADIGLTLLVGVVAFTLLFAVILVERYRIRRAEDDVTALRRTLQTAGANAR
jgi:heme exporter protein C